MTQENARKHDGANTVEGPQVGRVGWGGGVNWIDRGKGRGGERAIIRRGRPWRRGFGEDLY